MSELIVTRQEHYMPKEVASLAKTLSCDPARIASLAGLFLAESLLLLTPLPREYSERMSKELHTLATKVIHAAREILQPLMRKFVSTSAQWVKKARDKLPSKEWFERINAKRRRITSSPDRIFAKPVGGGASGWSLGSAVGGLIFATSVTSGVMELLGVIGSMMLIKEGIKLVQQGRQLREQIELETEKTPGASAALKSHRVKLLKKGAGKILLGTMVFAASIGSLLRASANLSLMAGAAGHVALHALIAAGTYIAAPITMGLCIYGAKRNISRIRRTSAQLVIVNQELARLEQLKKNNSLTAELQEREKLLLFAQRRLKHQRVDHICGLVSNIFMTLGSAALLVGMMAGPGAAIVGTVGCAFLAAGGTGLLIARAIIALRRSRAKTSKSAEFATYVSAKEMKQVATQLFMTDSHKTYNLSTAPSTWSNGELLSFLLLREGVNSAKVKRGEAANIIRENFLRDPELYWKSAF